MKAKFYLCPHCHNLIYMVNDSKVKPVCCGSTMIELEPNTVDAALEKHVPVYKLENRRLEVQVGSTIHPMLDNHHILFICLTTNKGVYFVNTKDKEEPVATFILDEDESVDTIYEYCNLHGLWSTK